MSKISFSFLRETICHWKNDDLPSQQRFSRFYSFKESINFLSIFPPSYSQLLRLYSFFTLLSDTLIQNIPDLKLFYDAYWFHRVFSKHNSSSNFIRILTHSLRVMRMCLADFLIRGAYGGLINYFKKCERWKRVFYVLAYELNTNVIISMHYFRCFFTIVFAVHLSKIWISASELKKMLNQ